MSNQRSIGCKSQHKSRSRDDGSSRFSSGSPRTSAASSPGAPRWTVDQSLDTCASSLGSSSETRPGRAHEQYQEPGNDTHASYARAPRGCWCPVPDDDPELGIVRRFPKTAAPFQRRCCLESAGNRALARVPPQRSEAQVKRNLNRVPPRVGWFVIETRSGEWPFLTNRRPR